jgi:glycosyltransferase involved in cell wall biosynthesis
LSIVIPAFNEAARLGNTLPEVIRYIHREHPAAELIVVDDGSCDDTAGIAARAFAACGLVRAEIVRYTPNRGKGYAVRRGLLAAHAPVVLFSDADLSTPIEETPKLVDPIVHGDADLTFGSRALDRALIGVRQPAMRDAGGRVFNAALRLATHLPFWDTQCGFKAFRMSVCRPIVERARVDRFGFDVELLYVAYRAGLRLREVAVRWDHREGSKVRVSRDAPRMLADIIGVRARVAAGVYDEAIHAASALERLELQRRQGAVPVWSSRPA